MAILLPPDVESRLHALAQIVEAPRGMPDGPRVLFAPGRLIEFSLADVANLPLLSGGVVHIAHIWRGWRAFVAFGNEVTAYVDTYDDHEVSDAYAISYGAKVTEAYEAVLRDREAVIDGRAFFVEQPALGFTTLAVAPADNPFQPVFSEDASAALATLKPMADAWLKRMGH
jgi:hypothetical protein